VFCNFIFDKTFFLQNNPELTLCSLEKTRLFGVCLEVQYLVRKSVPKSETQAGFESGFSF